MKWPLIFIVLIFSFFANAAKEKPQEKPKGPLVFAETVKPAHIYDLLTYPARLVPKINATLLAETDGVVEKILTSLGTTVNRNQVIMRLNHTDPVYKYAPVLVRTPVGGVVSGVEVTEGSRVAQGAKLGTIIDPLKLKIQIEVAVSDMQDITRGLEGDLRIPGEDKPFPVKVIGRSPFADPATGTASAELSLTDTRKGAPKLPPGMVGTVSFRARDHVGVEVPEDAIVYRGQDAFLRVVEKGKAKYQQVALGQTRSGSVEILKGLNAGQSVIVRASSYVGNGEEVNSQAITPPPGEADKS